MRGDQTSARVPIADTAADVVLIGLLAAALAAGIGMWLTGQLAALLFLGRWPSLNLADGLEAALHLPGHLGDPRQAWRLAPPSGGHGAPPGRSRNRLDSAAHRRQEERRGRGAEDIRCNRGDAEGRSGKF